MERTHSLADMGELGLRGVLGGRVGQRTHSLPYLARWADGDPAVVRRTAEQVVTTAAAGLTEGQRLARLTADAPRASPTTLDRVLRAFHWLDTDGLQRTP